MNSIDLVQSNVDALPPPNSDIALSTQLPAKAASLPFPSSSSSSPSESTIKQLGRLPAGPIIEGLGPWLGETLLSRWKSYRDRLKQCRDEPTPESIHELRVAIRRLISQFVLLSQILPDRGAEKARNFLKRQLESLGPLRDTHVQQMFFQQQVAKFADLAGLLKRLERDEPSLVDNARQNICRLKANQVEKWVCSLMKALNPPSPNRQTQQEFASSALRCADAAFTKVVERWRLMDRSDLRTIHRTRVAFKKFRYIVESLPPELTGYSQGDLRKLARYQRRMGNIQDFEVILQSVRCFIKQHDHSRLNAFCRYLEKRRTRAVRSFLKTSNRLFQSWPPRAIPATARRVTCDASRRW
jgi:CHAD domain-containing protein